MNDVKDTHISTLEKLLAKVQKESAAEPYIYGITPTESRNVWQRINDFLIDHSMIPLRQKGYFFELLGTMVHSGIPLNRALAILVSRTENRRLSRVLAKLHYDIEHGKLLSAAMDKFPEIFDESERGTIRGAEASGQAEKILFKLAETTARRSELHARMLAALIYPAMVLIALITGIIVILTVVVPRIKSIFEGNLQNISLPFITKIVIAASTIVINFWWLMLILFISGAVAFYLYINSYHGRFVWDFSKLRLPFIGRILRKIHVTRFSDTLGLLIESGVPITTSLELVARSMTNEIYRLKTYEALGHVQRGEKLSSLVMTAPFLFPETVGNMLAVGEYSASLGSMCQKIAAYFSKDIDYTLKTMVNLIGPTAILIMALLVAFFALAVLSPLFSLTQAIQ